MSIVLDRSGLRTRRRTRDDSRGTSISTMRMIFGLLLLGSFITTTGTSSNSVTSGNLGYDQHHHHVPVASVLVTVTATDATVGQGTHLPVSRSPVILDQQKDSDAVDDIYNKTLQDPRLHIETLYVRAIGLGIVTATAILSTLSSTVIIYVIARSSIGFGSVYHRIMLGLSTADILQSCAMALTTVPMPRDMIYEQFEGLVLGTSTTCSIQGFVYMCGFVAGTMYNSFLFYYYLCALHLQMQDATFRKYFEPLLHGFAISFSLIVATLSLNFGLMHPSPLYPFCTTTAYPYWCSTEDNCLSGHIWKQRVVVLWLVSAATTGITGVLGLLFSVIIIFSVYVREKRLRLNMKNDMRQDDDNEENRVSREMAWNNFTYTKSVMKQSLYYVMVYGTVYMFPLIRAVSDVTGETLPRRLSNVWFQVGYVILRPSQGTLNLLIFLYHKIWKIQKQFPTLRLSDALKSILKGEEAEDKAISSIELVRRDNALSALHFVSEQDLDPVEEEEGESSFIDDPNTSVHDEQSIGPDSSPCKSAVEVPSIGRVTRNSLGLSWMGLSLSAKDGSIQLSSHPSLSSNQALSSDDASSIYVTKTGSHTQLD